jgi:hypothetical protein
MGQIILSYYCRLYSGLWGVNTDYRNEVRSILHDMQSSSWPMGESEEVMGVSYPWNNPRTDTTPT